MNRFFTLLIAASCLTAVGQVTYPYNPDGNADAFIGVTDLQDILSTYGGAFVPSEILVGDSTLSSWVDQLSATVLTQQATIDSLVELQPKEYIITVADSLDGDWVTIASVGDDSTTPFKLRADADFEFTHNIGSSHQKIKVRASHLFGYGHTLDLHRISYSDSQAMIVAFRIAHGNTYDGAVLQMKVRQNSWGYNSIKLRVTNNNNDSGWHIHPDILQGQSLSADNSPIGYVVDHPLASDAPYVEFYPSIDGEDCLGYDTTEGDVILNSNLIVKGVNVAEVLQNIDAVEEDNLGPCQGEFTVNYHGYDYELVEIGDQCWFADNCRFLPEVSSGQECCDDDLAPRAFVQGYFGNDQEEATSLFSYRAFGALYSYSAAEEWALCPSGMRVASWTDWIELIDFVNLGGGIQGAGKALMRSQLDLLGFGVLPAGKALQEGFSGVYNYGTFWAVDAPFLGTSSDYRFQPEFNEMNSQGEPEFLWSYDPDCQGRSVRCIKDSE